MSWDLCPERDIPPCEAAHADPREGPITARSAAPGATTHRARQALDNRRDAPTGPTVPDCRPAATPAGTGARAPPGPRAREGDLPSRSRADTPLGLRQPLRRMRRDGPQALRQALTGTARVAQQLDQRSEDLVHGAEDVGRRCRAVRLPDLPDVALGARGQQPQRATEHKPSARGQPRRTPPGGQVLRDDRHVRDDGYRPGPGPSLVELEAELAADPSSAGPHRSTRLPTSVLDGAAATRSGIVASRDSNAVTPGMMS